MQQIDWQVRQDDCEHGILRRVDPQDFKLYECNHCEKKFLIKPKGW